MKTIKIDNEKFGPVYDIESYDLLTFLEGVDDSVTVRLVNGFMDELILESDVFTLVYQGMLGDLATVQVNFTKPIAFENGELGFQIHLDTDVTSDDLTYVDIDE